MEFVEWQLPYRSMVSHIGGGSCPTQYNLLWQPTGQLRELVEGAAAQQIIIWAADQLAKAGGSYIDTHSC